MFFFVAVYNSLRARPDRPEGKAWMCLVVLLRALLLPDDEFESSNIDLEKLQRLFYKGFNRTCGDGQCVYNVHCVGAHSHTMREHGALYVTSTFPFEGWFANFPRWFKPGTQSIGKQILIGALSSLSSQKNHSCERAVVVSPTESYCSQQNLFYTFENSRYYFWKCVRLTGDGRAVAKRFQTATVSMFDLPFDSVGCFRMAGLEDYERVFSTDQIRGYAVRAEDWIVSVPHGCIQEL